MDQLEKLTASLLESYDNIGGLNHIHGPNLPSRLSIQNIIDDLEGLIFPGYKCEEPLDTANIRYSIGERLNRVMKNLTKEITKSLCFQRRLDGDPYCMNDPGSGEIAKCRSDSEVLTVQILNQLPAIRSMVHKDVEAALKGDPASRSHEEVILSYPGVEAIMIHRVAHELWIRDIPLIPRMMSEHIHGKTGIDIHPGAQIGESFFIDHATGVVIGETTVIGKNVKIYQGVTIGALSVKKEEANTKRHPTIEDDVTIYSGATILGGKTVIGRNSIIGGNVWLTHSVPAGSRIYIRDPEHVIRNKYEHVQDFQI
ncbi:serine O-acetyltransferase EpsC [Salinispira pacifica]|uniref:Serine acetyltransferase n=1 Tax=Salinispira pacifica TaxID=1307761 RepID=V5WD33_9SPIO|nr:serine O-acetyltransferase EpsC [Salinispira pacifica]AHC13733.1 Serine acetyltransferase [Salinispira pacifica]